MQRMGNPFAGGKMDNSGNGLFHATSGLTIQEKSSPASIKLPVSSRTLIQSASPFIELEWEDGFLLDGTSLVWADRESAVRMGAITGGTARSEQATVDITVLEDPYGPFLQYRLRVTNWRDCALVKVRLTPINCPEIPDDWSLTLPFGGGWGIRKADYPEGYTLSLRYPVQGCLQWVCLFDRHEGISVSVRDDSTWIKDILINRQQDHIQVGVQFVHLNLMEQQAVDLPAVAVGAHKGGWQEGARIYAGWLRSAAPNPAIAPPWLVQSPAWAWGMGKGQLAEKPDTMFSELPEYSKRLGAVGIKTIQLAAWLEHGHDTRYPDYIAGECMGGEEALSEAALDIQAAGRKLALYTNGRLFDPASEAAKFFQNWPDWAVTGPEGKSFAQSIGPELVGVTNKAEVTDWDPEDRLAKETYSKVTFAVMCPGSEDWQELYTDRLKYAAGRYHIDGLYMDQVLGAVASPCYSRRHEHQKPYESWTGYHDLLSEAREKVKGERPEAYLATEGFSDILGQYFDIVQSHNDWIGPCPPGSFPFPEMARHAVPWLLQALGPIRDGQLDFLALCHAGASGLDFACQDYSSNGPFANAIRKAMQWRERFGRHTYRSTPLPAFIGGFPDRRVMAIQSEMTLAFIACLDEDRTRDITLVIANVDGRSGGELAWEGLYTEGQTELKASGDYLVARFPWQKMAVCWIR